MCGREQRMDELRDSQDSAPKGHASLRLFKKGSYCGKTQDVAVHNGQSRTSEVDGTARKCEVTKPASREDDQDQCAPVCPVALTRRRRLRCSSEPSGFAHLHNLSIDLDAIAKKQGAMDKHRFHYDASEANNMEDRSGVNTGVTRDEEETNDQRLLHSISPILKRRKSKVSLQRKPEVVEHEHSTFYSARKKDVSGKFLRWLLSFLFLFFSYILNLLASVVAGYRTPNYPPLPDLGHQFLHPIFNAMIGFGAESAVRMWSITGYYYYILLYTLHGGLGYFPYLPSYYDYLHSVYLYYSQQSDVWPSQYPTDEYIADRDHYRSLYQFHDTKYDTQYVDEYMKRHLSDFCLIFNLMWTLALVLRDRRRLVISRRVFAVLGFILLFRSYCVTVTNLPDMSPHCRKQFEKYWFTENETGKYKSQPIFPKALHRTYKMLYQPLEDTCGDLMFSGHTVGLWICFLTVREYFAARRSYQSSEVSSSPTPFACACDASSSASPLGSSIHASTPLGPPLSPIARPSSGRPPSSSPFISRSNVGAKDTVVSPDPTSTSAVLSGSSPSSTSSMGRFSVCPRGEVRSPRSAATGARPAAENAHTCSNDSHYSVDARLRNNSTRLETTLSTPAFSSSLPLYCLLFSTLAGTLAIIGTLFHYTLDVSVAIFVTYSCFTLYHRYATNQRLQRHSGKLGQFMQWMEEADETGESKQHF